MSGGQLVVMDRGGRDVKRYELPAGLVTLGSHPDCDIRVMLPTVLQHHATVTVHHNQTVVRDMSEGCTLVNGLPVSVHALRHGDVLTLGDRSLRWEYTEPQHIKQAPTPPVVPVKSGAKPKAPGRGRKRASEGATRRLDPALHLMLEMKHRASVPGGAKQVAIVQPQRRDAVVDGNETKTRVVTKARQKPQSTTKRSLRKSTKAEQNIAISNETNDTSTRNIIRNTNKTSPNENATRKSTRDSNRGRTSKEPIMNLSQDSETKASQWIASRKSSPKKTMDTVDRTPKSIKYVHVATPRPLTPYVERTPSKMMASSSPRHVTAKRSVPLRTVVLRKAVTPKLTPARSTQKPKVIKIQAPLVMDKNKKAALMILTRTPRSKLFSPQAISRPNAPSLVVKRTSPMIRTPRRSSLDKTPPTARLNPKSGNLSTRSSKRISESVSLLELTDSDEVPVSARQSSDGMTLPLPISPRKSALKNPTSKKSLKKSESIKFNLSNLETNNESSDILILTNSTIEKSGDSYLSDKNSTLHYSETKSPIKSPSPTKSPARGSINSRSLKILEQTLGYTPVKLVSWNTSAQPQAANPIPPLRSSLMIQKALEKSSKLDRSPPGSPSLLTKSRSMRSTRDLESYSIVDLVSLDSNDTVTSSVYTSADSNASTVSFGTPKDKHPQGRRGRSSITPTIIGSSTPLVQRTPRMLARKAVHNLSNATMSIGKRSASVPTKSENINSIPSTNLRSKSLSTPIRKGRSITINSTVSSGRGNDSASFVSSRYSKGDYSTRMSDSEASKTMSRASEQSRDVSSRSSSRNRSHRNTLVVNETQKFDDNGGPSTPENMSPPVEVGTPVLNIQNLLNASRASINKQLKNSRKPLRKTIRPSGNKRCLVPSRGVLTEPRRKSGRKSVGLNLSNVRKVILRRQSDGSGASDKTDENAPKPSNDETVTPKSTVKLVPEAVKHQHSTAKKPKSKRSIIDNLDDSDIVKQLFNSPVKRKLSQSMSEFSKHQLSDDETVANVKKTRRTVALTDRTPNQTFDIENSLQVPTEIFVSPLNTPTASPNLLGIKKLFARNTPRNDLRNIKGVKSLLRTPRNRRSPRNDLTNVSGVKAVFGKGKSPKNDLRKVSGVKSLFQSEKERKSPRNDLTDIRGVKNLFSKGRSPKNDLTNVDGVKRVFTRNSPKNDLRDVRGVKRLLRHEKSQNGLDDLSGVEQLFDISHTSDKDHIFNQLVGKPSLKATYSKSFIAGKKTNKSKKQASQSLVVPMEMTTNNVEQWLEQELQRQVRKNNVLSKSPKAKSFLNKSKNISFKPNLSRELLRLTTDTVAGDDPIRNSRVRSTTLDPRGRSASSLDRNSLPLKKRSLAKATIVNDSGNYLLPIKKRVLVHSTPVKGKRGTIVVAREMGKVSPIVAAEQSVDLETVLIRLTSPNSKNKSQIETKTTRGRRGTKQSVPTAVKPNFKKSPKKTMRATKANPQTTPVKRTRGRKNNTGLSQTNNTSKAKPQSPVKRTTRGRKNNVELLQTSNTKKRRSSLIISKKTPIMSPKKPSYQKKSTVQTMELKAKDIEKTTQASPKSTRNTRNRQKVKAVTPKSKSRAQNKKNGNSPSIIVTKPSPKLKPQSERMTRGKKAIKEISFEKPKDVQKNITKGRKEKTIKSEGPIIESNIRRGRVKNDSKPNKSVEKAAQEIQATRKTRGRKTVVTQEVALKNNRRAKSVDKKTVVDVKSQGKRGAVEKEEVVVKKTRRNVKLEADPVVVLQRGRSRRVASPKAVVSPAKDALVVKKQSRGRKRKSDGQLVDSGPLAKEASKPGTRTRKAAEKPSSPVRATRGKSTRSRANDTRHNEVSAVSGTRSSRRRQ